MTSVLPFQYDSNEYINYIGDEPGYYPDAGPVVLPEVQTPRVSGHDLDALELASGGKIVLTTQGDSKALEVSSIGEADPAVMDTTVLDTGTKKLKMSSDVGTDFTAANISFNASADFYSTIGIADPADPTFHQYADSARQTLGVGVLDVDKNFTSGGWLETTATSFDLRHDNSSIYSETGADSRIDFRSPNGHDFFVGTDALTQSVGSSAVEIRADKITIRKDVDLLGTLNSVVTNSEQLRVEDQIIRLAHTDDEATKNRDTLLAASKTGITIETVPGSVEEDVDYMSRFKNSYGTRLFVTTEIAESGNIDSIDVPKALASGLFTKEVAYYLNGGAKASGMRDTTSRLNEPAWQISGGAMHLSHTVPNGPGKARKFSLGFRVADDGTMEMVRLTRNLLWDDGAGKFAEDAGDPATANVITRYVNPVVAAPPMEA